MNTNNMYYLTGENHIYYPGFVNSIKKDSNALRSIFEALTNSIEALSERCVDNGKIEINIYLIDDTLHISESNDNLTFDKICIIDNGMGFNSNSFERFVRINDNTKGNLNKGSGRFQFLKTFKMTEINSSYSENNKVFERYIQFSADNDFLQNNAIIKVSEPIVTQKEIETTITFKECLNNKDESLFSRITVDELKQKLIYHFLLKFYNIKQIPKIIITRYKNNEVFENIILSKNDFPKSYKEMNFNVSYKKYENDEFIDTGKRENIKLVSYKLETKNIDSNNIFLTSKGEIVTPIDMNCLKANENINGFKFIFLLSCDYFDKKVSETRSSIELGTRKKIDLYNVDEELYIEDVIEITNKQIISNFPEIKEKQNELRANIEELQKLFNLDKRTIETIPFSMQDDDKKILEKIYKAESDKIAQKDATLKNLFEQVKQLNPIEKDYENKITALSEKINANVPITNKNALSQYFARRKIVLEEMNLVLERELEYQEKGRNIDEKLLHNILFRQHTNKPIESDLWVLNEDFIYFQGTSESKLQDITINNEKIFQSEFAEIEDTYYEKRKIKRPDVLLFPEESKCIIIEFKSPEVDVSEYIQQVTKYATWIRTYTHKQFELTTFYAYLIGENIDEKDITSADSDFISAYNFDYMFRPHKRIPDLLKNRESGSLYMEIIKYSTLLKRAIQRNKIFIEKLGLQ